MKDSFKNFLIGFLIGIICLLVVVILMVVSGKLTFTEKIDNKDDDKVDLFESIKVYADLDLIYDASYEYKNRFTEYSSGDEVETIDRGIAFKVNWGKQSLKDLKVPYINIKSNDADNVNQTLRDLYIEYAKNFDYFAENIINGIVSKQVLTYYSYINDNILSVVVISGVQSTGNWNPSYDTYNFDLTNGELLTFSEGIAKLGYNNKEEIVQKFELNIKNKMDELFGQFGDLSNSCYTSDGERTNCYNAAYNSFKYLLDKDAVSYFVNNEGKLAIFFVPSYSNVESGMWTYLVKIN